MNVEITAIYTSLIAILTLVLAYRVTVFRRRLNAGFGDKGDRAFSVAIRAHANMIEYAPISLLLLFAENLIQSSLVIHVFGGLLVLSRGAHAFGYTRALGGYSPFRMYGIILNWLVILIVSLCNLYWVLVL